MLSEGLAPWSLSCLRMFTGFVLRGICACVAIGPEIGVHRVFGAGFDTLIFQSPRKFVGAVNLATFAVPRSFVAQ